MDKFQELVEKAKKELEQRMIFPSADTAMYRGIGYAILALALAIKDKDKE